MTGYVMYPNESEIGLRWSPGSKAILARNIPSAKWYSAINSPVRFDIASKVAPVMRRSLARGGAPRSEAFVSSDVWVSCDSR